MLSYQHAFHAGNPADLHKHFVLAGLLAQLTRKPRPISYMEPHAGRGLYDLSAPEAQKTGEAALGIARVTLPDGPYAQALAATRAQHGENTYPGSPLIAQTLLRDADQLHLMELHPAEHAALRRNLMGANTHIHHRSGPEGVLALSPPKPRRGLVLVDPSYEVKTEYESTAAFARALVAKWPISRIDPTLRALFRAAGAEFLETDTPPRVVITEFVQLAQAFFPEGRESKFVNAVLDHMAREARPGAFSA